ncbi:hypothetical protein HPB52_000260 [Rhipicephalus sanguineus]|uniref:Uncharacterized protein n=1 Tax=Rhipicephalus sanguineus TaxID=34632 RepID=A0A9D4PLY7_RHISA|nr:hypothetical protein HPB52_000260 [Rhipicephalus sanguineus]
MTGNAEESAFRTQRRASARPYRSGACVDCDTHEVSVLSGGVPRRQVGVGDTVPSCARSPEAQAFLSGGDASSEGQARLRSLLLEQVHVLEGGLSLHGRLAPPDLGPLQKRLVERLGQLQQAVRGASAHGSPRPGSACSSSRSSTSSSGLLPPTHDEPWDGGTSSSSSSTLADQQQLEGSMVEGTPPPLPPRACSGSGSPGPREGPASQPPRSLSAQIRFDFLFCWPTLEPDRVLETERLRELDFPLDPDLPLDLDLLLGLERRS